MTTPARYWRVYFRSTTVYDFGQLGVRSMRFFSSAGTNLSESLTSAQISTTFPQYNSTTHPLTNLVDGSTTTAWVINWSTYQTTSGWYYVQFDFGSGNDVLPEYIELHFDATAYNGYTVVPVTGLDFTIDSSTDNITYARQAMHYRPITATLTNTRIAAVVTSAIWPIPSPVQYGGSGGIYGIVSEDGTALANRPVVLFERDTFYKIGYTTTDVNGGYAFNGLNTAREFTVMSYDPSGPPYKNALIWDRITPINTLGNITPQSAFFARRIRDSALGAVATYPQFLDGATYKFFGNGVLGSSGLNIYSGSLTYQAGYNFDVESAVGGALKFLKSNRTPTVTGYGIGCFPGSGLFSGVNSTGQSANYQNLTFEYIFKAPTATESALIYVWGGTRESDDAGLWGFDSYYSGVALRWSGPTLEITPAGAINVRFPVGGRNRSTVRATATITPGTVHHVMVTYTENASIKLYLDGTLVQTASVSGGGRMWGHQVGYTNTENWDNLYNGNHADAAIRRLTALSICGYGVNPSGNTTQHLLGPGWGGAHAFAAVYGRTFSDANVASFYDSYANWSTHTVPASLSGYSGEVEADNPEYYIRFNDLTNPTRFNALVGRRDYLSTIEGTLGYNATPFVAGSPSTTFTNGSVRLDGTYTGSTFSIECFVRPASTAGTQRIFLSRINNGSAPVYLSMISGVLSLSVTDISGTTTTYSFNYTLTAGTAYHVVVTHDPWDSKRCKLYINGAVVSDSSCGVLPYTATQSWLFIGANGSGSAPSISERFVGQIGELAYYGYELPAARIQAHYDARNS